MKMHRLTIVAFAIAAAASAQQPMGTVATRDALVTGGLQVSGEQATLVNNASITARDHTAAITLARGGEALVCATSQFHLLHAGAGPALLFGLDRGAVQISTPTQPQDLILTPDIRFAVEHAGQFDLRLRVTRDGDTCVDNHGPAAPVLLLSASFSGATYRLLPGQHVLFEHGDLRQVVDHERTACGCPDLPATPTQLAANATPAERAAAAHPFPTADSADLTATPQPLPPTGGNVQSTTDFHINAGDTTATALTTTPPQPGQSQPPPASAEPHGFFHAIGHFFKRLFS